MRWRVDIAGLGGPPGLGALAAISGIDQVDDGGEFGFDTAGAKIMGANLVGPRAFAKAQLGGLDLPRPRARPQ